MRSGDEKSEILVREGTSGMMCFSLGALVNSREGLKVCKSESESAQIHVITTEVTTDMSGPELNVATPPDDGVLLPWLWRRADLSRATDVVCIG